MAAPHGKSFATAWFSAVAPVADAAASREMGDHRAWRGRGPAAMAPLTVEGGGEALAGGMDGASGAERWGHFSSSVNAVSFGFVAIAILISMFLVMAVFERFLRPRPLPPPLSLPSGRTWHGSRWRWQNMGNTGVDSGEAEAGASQQGHDRPHLPEGPFSGKLGYPSPKGTRRISPRMVPGYVTRTQLDNTARTRRGLHVTGVSETVISKSGGIRRRKMMSSDQTQQVTRDNIDQIP